MEIIFRGHKKSKSGKGINLIREDANYNISFETLFEYGIHEDNCLNDFIIITDDSKTLRSSRNWFFIKPINILRIINNELEAKEFYKKQIEKAKIEDEKYFKNLIDDDSIEETQNININFETIYKDIDFYEIKEIKKNQMTQNEKLIQKSIKLKPTKYFNSSPKIHDINFDLLKNLTSDRLDLFIEGEIQSIKIKMLQMPLIPKSYKEDNNKILDYISKKGFDSFISETDKNSFLKNLISLKDFLEKTIKKSTTKFNKITETVRKAKMIERETGINPLVIAWPFVKGKTEKGKSIHCPIAYRNLDIKESLNEYELTLDNVFTINTYPILKNYVDNHNEVNDIIPQHSNIKDILIEFYKHGIKISKPKEENLSKFKKVPLENSFNWANNSFNLSNEVIIQLKPSDEYIYYDLKNIVAKEEDFELPQATYDFEKSQPLSSSMSFITDVDKSKSIAINESLKKSIVIFGPPGTGKSAAITNIIGKMIEKGKTSLFVTEKATAIEVIESNLEKINFDDFVINLNNVSKMKFIKKFNSLSKIIHNPNYKEIQKIPTEDFAKKWFNSNIEIFQSFEKVNEIIDNKTEILYELVEFKNQFENISLLDIPYLLESKDEFKKNKQKLSTLKMEHTKLNKKSNKLHNIFKKIEDSAIERINNNEIVQNYVDSKEQIENISNSKTMEIVLEQVQNKKPFFMKKYLKQMGSHINLLKQDCVNYIREYKETQENINDLNQKIKCKKNELIELENEVQNFDEKIFEYIDLRRYFFKKLKKEDLEIIEKELDTIKSINKEDWEKHIQERKKYFIETQKLIVNNYSVNMKNFLSIDNNMETFRRLTTFINNKLEKKGQSIIKIFKEAWHMLKQVFPSIMMNPDYVSIIFPTDKNIFDFGIFDEASQIRLHRAMGTLHRCKKAIVAGDDKQLGPTDLFTQLDREDDYDLDLEEDTSLSNDTLLNYAKDKYYWVRLNNHYRSSSKDLIEFSNKNFYNDNIMIADSPRPSFDGNPPIIVEEINGLWSEDRTNIEEAIRVVELVEYYYGLKKSIGIITFNDQQKALINKLLLNKENLREFISYNSNDFFIKAIRNVQGDEKDIIIFSIAYGRRKISKQYVSSFGVFSKEKINVAITRSRKRIHVIKSIPSSAIEATNDDKYIFKKWLEYIEKYSLGHKGQYDPINHENTFRSDLERDYFKSMKEILGERYIPMMNFKVANKEIDVVIFDNLNKEFVGAIELDGSKYHSETEQFMKDYERQLFLENLGWNFVRTTYYDFYKNREKRVKSDFKLLLSLSE